MIDQLRPGVVVADVDVARLEPFPKLRLVTYPETLRLERVG